MVRANNAVIEWNEQKKRWEVRVQVGAEVIKRPLAKHTEKPASANVDSALFDDLKSEAVTVARDEGYEVDPAQVTVVQR